MATTSSPTWAARHNGIIGQADATIRAADINQLLSTHGDSPIYQGNAIVTPSGQGGTDWALALDTLDIDQPFTMSGTTIGRVTIPILPVGNGADLIVSLCSDSSGNPGTVITRTRVPAAWINQFAAVSGVSAPSSQPPATQYTSNPLAVAQFNAFHTTGYTSLTIALPAVNSFSSCPYGTYVIWTGGTSAVGTLSVVNSVNTVAMDNAGNAGPVTPQPSLPVALVGHAQTVATESNGNATLIVVGGNTATPPTTTLTNAVFTAAFDAATGVLSAWSKAALFPVALESHSMAADGAFVYVVGGSNGSTNLATTYWASVTNGQVGTWTQGPSLPTLGSIDFTVVSNGFLYAVVGQTVYYAPINTDGSLGTWQNGPSLPVALGSGAGGPVGIALDTYGVCLSGSGGTPIPLFLGVTPSGGDVAWMQCGGIANSEEQGVVSNANGTWQLYGFSGAGTATVSLTPRVSVPLPATGLTNTATYHLLLQQPNGDPGDYLRTSVDLQALPGSPTLKTSPKGSNTWSAYTAQYAIPIQIWDNSNGSATANGASGNDTVWHTWEDNGARIATLVRATTPDQRLIGIAEATVIPTQMNSNSGFETTLSPWAIGATGTLVRSNAQAYEGSWSARCTPNGTSANVFFQSENMRCVAGQKITVSMWVYAASTITNNFSATLFWYNASGVFISESDNLVSIPANTWTFVTNTFSAPANAYQFSINPRQSGTPPVGNVFYVDQVMAYDPYTGPQLASVTQIGYPGRWPGSQLWPPSGVTQLA